MIKAVIFDCFGVIITDALQLIVDDIRDQNPKGAQEIKNLVRASNRGIIDPKESNKQIAQILELDLEEYRQKIRDGEVRDERVLSLVKELKQSYKIAMLSNISATGLQKRFSPDELKECFDEVVSSGEIGYAKPEPEAYETVAARLAVRLDECVFTDDREEFCEAAQGVGMKAIVYIGFDQFKRDLSAILSRPL